ncbi:MAG TPA: carbamoyltransferase C-terminal domain-containing protein [Nitrospiraceae bacterium]|nr:carbamoyltransferase C-terminal domain-containing protein [Nitrospiraceae bacterium]
MILGINEGIDASVVLCCNGEIVFAVQEERLRREKGYIGFPLQAVLHCLKAYDLDSRSLDHVCFSNLFSPADEPRGGILRYYGRNGGSWRDLLRTRDFSTAAMRMSGLLPPSLQTFAAAQRFLWRGAANNLRVERRLARCGLDGIPISRFHHHSNHAASVYYALRKNWDEPHLVFTLDGGGDDSCAHVYLAQRGKLRLLAATPNGHSLGNIYAAVTFMLGMHPHEHEYKVMALAPYAVHEEAQVWARLFNRYLDLDPTNPMRFRRRIAQRTSAILPRLFKDFRSVRFDRIAAGLQFFTEELIKRWILGAVQATGVKNVLAAGGVFMNVKVNKQIAECPDVRSFDVFPSCGDETLPFGAVWQAHLRRGGRLEDIRFESIYLGPEAGDDLSEAEARYGETVQFEYCEEPEVRTGELLAKGHIVARCAGRMEFGARALGNRSILADPGHASVVGEINRRIKGRDFWMPFAPAVLAEKADQYFRIPGTLPEPRISPYMMHVFDTTEARDELAASVHSADGTARAQVVWRDLSPGFHRVIEHFGRLTGRWVVLNTSFNLHGHPIVAGACDAVEVFLRSNLEYLMIDRCLVTKRRGAPPDQYSASMGGGDPRGRSANP